METALGKRSCSKQPQGTCIERHAATVNTHDGYFGYCRSVPMVGATQVRVPTKM